MANGACFCGGGLKNLGVFSCATNPKVTKKSIFMNRIGSDGSVNSILASAFVNGKLSEAYILSKLDAPLAADRWFLTPDLYEEVTSARTDETTETFASGSSRTLSNGVPTFEAKLIEVPQAWSANLNSGSCADMAVFPMDSEGSLLTIASKDKSEYFPLPIQRNTLNAKFFPATDTTGVYTMVNYQIDKTVDESRAIAISSEQIDVNLLTALGLIDIVLVQGGTTTATNLFVQAESDIYGNANAYEKLLGATVSTDWTVLDGVTPVTVTSATEDQTAADYNYDLLIPTTAATALTVSYLKTRTSVSEFGFIASAITITTP